MEYANCGMAGTYAIVSQRLIKRKLGRGHFFQHLKYKTEVSLSLIRSHFSSSDEIIVRG